VRIHGLRLLVSVMAIASMCGFLVGCGAGDGGLENSNPGNNDVNVVVAFGDSITQGSECPCVPYPARLSGLIGKTVFNTGIGGSKATSSIGRTQDAINKYHPGFMLILYGINDIIHGGNVANIIGALSQMVAICKQNNVVPVLATYPIPTEGHWLFSGGTTTLNNNIRALAAAQGIKCVDLEPEFMGDNGPDFTLYMPDGLHPNDAGTQIMALSFADLF
jgi:lysophospholipase L1-like esterase